MIILPQAYACDDWRTRFAATNEYIISIISKHFCKHKISSRRASNECPYRIDTEKHGLFIFRTSRVSYQNIYITVLSEHRCGRRRGALKVLQCGYGLSDRHRFVQHGFGFPRCQKLLLLRECPCLI